MQQPQTELKSNELAHPKSIVISLDLSAVLAISSLLRVALLAGFEAFNGVLEFRRRQ